jgi:hypothetical protein
MQKKYRYQECKEFKQMEGADSHLARFSFLEISEVAEEQSAAAMKEVMVKISNPAKNSWQQRNAKTDDDIIKVLSGIAKEHGLKKGVKEIIINGDTYPDGIDRFEEYGMEEGLEFTIP